MLSAFARQTCLLLFPLLARLVLGANDDDARPAAGIFVYPTERGSDFVFALNVVDNADMYFHLSGPSAYSWLAVGIGEEMDNALMLIVHKGDSDRDSLTLSPRVAFDGTSEPTYYPAIRCEQLAAQSGQRSDDQGADGSVSINAVCHNASAWDGGSLDLRSSSQSFMFAFGPKHDLRSDSLLAPLLRHEQYGNFEMDMTKATSTAGSGGSVPAPDAPDGTYVQANAFHADDVASDGDKTSIIHGVVMCVAYILLYPLGALLLRLVKRVPVRVHWICQSVASVLVVVGFGLGIAASQEYNRSRDYDDPHQIIGIVLLVALVVQLALGAVHHVIFKWKSKSKKTVLSRFHLVIGPLIILLAMVNGGLGLNLACEYQVISASRLLC